MHVSLAPAVCLDVTGRAWRFHCWSRILRSIGEFRCRLLHRSISHPIRGRYRCWTCLREYEFRW